LKEYVGKLTDLVTGTGSVNVENIDRLQLCKLNIEKKSKRHLYDGKLNTEPSIAYRCFPPNFGSFWQSSFREEYF
jgi:hypothetical protein